MDLTSLGEFGFLRRVHEWTGVAVDDDVAILDHLALTTDLLIEGRHFRLDWSSPADVGWKAVAVNVSDLASAAARPHAILVGLGVPKAMSEDVLRGLYDGIAEACTAYGCSLAGGDTVRSDELVLAVTAIGDLDGTALRRADARPGDTLVVTGPLGRAAAGVNLLLSQDPRGVAPEDYEACVAAHRRPRARVSEAFALRDAGAHAAIDLSDGLASDARRLAEACGYGVEIDDVPIAEEVRRIAGARGWDAEMLALGGGEDYELLAAVSPGASHGVLEIGRVVAEPGVRLRGEPMPEAGWDSFR